jgi:group II intron reverse transcriptase/maturase
MRIRRGTYRPEPSRIVEIPKEDGSTRPLAIACFEDKIVQLAVSTILSAIYEPIFLKCSFGFRPNLSCHDAIKTLSQTMFKVQDGAVVEIDLRKYFNSIPHGPMLDMLHKKISDLRFVRLISVLLQAPTLSPSGKSEMNKIGSPQGSIVSPVLANVFLHHAIDEWFTSINQSHFGDQAWEIRYADDMVFVFNRMSDAVRFHRSLGKRLNKYGIEINEEKSSLIPAGKRAALRASNQGKRIPTFKFLGFVCYWGRSRSNKKLWCPKLKSRGDRKSAKLKNLRAYLWKNRNTSNTQKVLARVIAGVRGWVTYHAISDNYRAVSGFIKKSARALFKWLNRRGRKRAMKWTRFNKLLVDINYPLNPKLFSLYPTPKKVY